MGQSSPPKLSTDIARGEFKGLYYFFGSEDYRISEAVKYVAQQFLPGKQVMTNFSRLDGRKTKCSDLIAELSIFPMLGERQVFAVSDFQSYKPTEVDRVLKLLVPPDPNRIVVLSSPSVRTPKKNSAFYKRIIAVAETIEFKKLDPQQAAGQVNRELTKAGLTISPEALKLLVELLAGNRGALSTEVAKLIDYKAPGEMVTEEDVRAVAGGYEAYEIFQLADEVLGGDRVRALHMIKRLLVEGSSPTGILFFLGQHVVSLYVVKGGRSLEPNRRWLEMKFREQAGRFSLKQLEQAILLIAQTDADLRHRRNHPELELDRLVLQLMTP
jgi:DNA polymerase III subunit delta